MNEIFNFKERWEGEIDRKKRKLINILLVLAAVAVLFLLAQSLKTFREWTYVGTGVPATNTISVNGEGEVFAVPDIAEITFSSRVEKKTVSEAQKEVTATMNAAIDFAKKSGVAEKDIKTVSYSAYPHYEYDRIVCVTVPCPPTKQTLTGYEVNHAIIIKVRDTDTTGIILDGLGKLKLTDISGPNFSIDDDNVIKAEARKKAIDDAKDKAEKLAKDLDVRLVRIVGFSEGGNYPIYYSKAVGMGGAVADESAPAPSVPKGENKITSNVTITYEVR